MIAPLSLLVILSAGPNGLAPMEINVVEPAPAPLAIGKALADALSGAGWGVVVAHTTPEQCSLTGSVVSKKSPKGVTTHYTLRVQSDTDSPLASVEGDVKNATAHNAQ